VIEDQATSCLLHIPHHRWLDGGADKGSIKKVEQKSMASMSQESAGTCISTVAKP
jgi:hypothetical protein